MDWFFKPTKNVSKEITAPTIDDRRIREFGNGFLYPIITTNQDYISYLNIPELAIVLYLRSKMMASGKLDVISDATGKPAPANESLVKILRSPNYFQGYSEFWRQASIYRDVYGKQFFYFLTPLGMPNTYKGLFNLNPGQVEIKIKDKSKSFFDELDYSNIEFIYTDYYGRKQTLEKERLIYLNDPQIKTSNYMDAKSKIEILKPALDNIKEAYIKRNVVHKLTTGIFSGNTVDALGAAVQNPLDVEEQNNIEDKLRRRGQSPIITHMNLSYDNLNINPQQMGLFDEVEADTTKVCDMFGIPYALLSNYKNSSLGSKGTEIKETKKQVYEDVIIPDFQEIVDAINNHVGADQKSWTLKADWSHLTVFSENYKERATTIRLLSESLIKLVESGLITQEQAKKELAKLNI